MKYREFFTYLREQKINSKSYAERAKLINNYIDALIEKAPGKTRREKVDSVWEKYGDLMTKLGKGLDSLGKASIFGRIGVESEESRKSKFNSDKYYIRFGDFPKSGKSTNWHDNTIEQGVSAYSAKWDIINHKWKILDNELNELAALYTFVSEIAEGKGRPVYLIQGREFDDVGSDGEAMLDINNVKIVKKLAPDEFYSNEIGLDWYAEYTQA